MIRSKRRWSEALIGVLSLGLGMWVFFTVTAPPPVPEEPRHLVAVGFEGVRYGKVAVWVERIDPLTRHNATDVDAGDGRVVRIQFLVEHTTEMTAPKVYLVGVSDDQVLRCTDGSDDTAAPTHAAQSIDAIGPAPQDAIRDYFVDPERHGDAINTPSWDSSESITEDEAMKEARGTKIVEISATALSTQSDVSDETLDVIRQRFSCDLDASEVWSEVTTLPIPIPQSIEYRFPAVSSRIMNAPDTSALELSSQHLVVPGQQGRLASELTQENRASGQLYVDTESTGRTGGTNAQQLRRVSLSFTPSSWSSLVQWSTFLAGVFASLGVTLFASGISRTELQIEDEA